MNRCSSNRPCNFSIHRTYATLAAALLLLSISAPAQACWDGYSAQYGNVTVRGGDYEWSAERAQRLALWLPRLNALAGEGGLDVYDDVAEFEQGSVAYPPERLDLLFARLARRLGLNRSARRTAMNAGGEAFTVQIASSPNRARAEALAERLRQADPGNLTGQYAASHGYYEAGGFPADNNPIHVVEALNGDGERIFRVVVGAFLSGERAEEVAVAMQDAHEIRSFVRRL